MNQILEFVRSGGGLSDEELDALVRENMQKIPAKTQRKWLRQLLLALHGYGLPHHLAAAERVKDAVKRVDPEFTA